MNKDVPTSDRLDALRFKKTILIRRKSKLSDSIQLLNYAIAGEIFKLEEEQCKTNSQ